MVGMKTISEKLKQEFIKQVDTYVESFCEKYLKWSKLREWMLFMFLSVYGFAQKRSSLNITSWCDV